MSESTIAILFVLGLCLLGGMWFLSSAMKDSEAAKEDTQVRLQQAKKAYQASLDALKADPTNAALRQQALALGRAYAALTREGAVTIYDETAIANDISAATGGK